MIVFKNKNFSIVKVLILLFRANTAKVAQTVPPIVSQNGNNALHHYRVTTNEVPFHVLIAYHSLYCSGALIQSKVVVTTASCFIKWQGHRIVVKVGSDTVTGIGQVIEAVEVKKHEYFGHSSLMDNDIAILMLKEHVQFDTYVKKIVLMEPDKPLVAGSVLDVSGYADQQPHKFANCLLWSEMTLLNDAECLELYPGLMTHSNYCVKYAAERSLSDNGGPAVFKDMLVGILSYGAANEEEPFVAVLTNVSYFHNWISLNSMRFMLKYCVDPVKILHSYDPDVEEYRK